MKIVFVYLGENLPKYVLANMRQVRSRFPENEIVFVGDSQKICAHVGQSGFSTWLSPDPEKHWVINRSSLSHDPKFRDGFWFKTLARFYSLNEYLKTSPNMPVILIESDVWISPDFPFHTFENAFFDCAYPLTTPTQGVASTFYIKSSKAMDIFLKFAERLAIENSNETDVTILGSFYKSNLLNTTILPTALPDSKCFNLDTSLEAESLLSNQAFFPDGLFDASTWGMYLTGQEPRNSWGFRRVFFNQLHHAVNPSVFSFSTNHGSVSAQYKTQLRKIYTLHVHSKQVKIFADVNFLDERVAQAARGERSEPVLKYVIRFLPSRAKYLLLKKLSEYLNKSK